MYEKTNLIPVFDYTAAVIKSDRLVPEELWAELKDGVKLLEEVPDEEKDWHPGSHGKVLDLVHPSLFPLVYGTSRIVADKRIGLADALESCGTGDVIPTPERLRGETFYSTSEKFQWLPCDVSVNEGRVKIESYINNLHPVKHAALYPIIEKFIEKALPAWDVVYRWPQEFEMQRLTIDHATKRCRTRRTCAKSDHSCSPKARPTRDDEPARERHEDEYSDSAVSESEQEIDEDDDGDDDEGVDSEVNSDAGDESDGHNHNVYDRMQNQPRDKDDGIPLVLPIRPKGKDVLESEYETEEYDSEKNQEDEDEQNVEDDKAGEDEDIEDEDNEEGGNNEEVEEDDQDADNEEEEGDEDPQDDEEDDEEDDDGERNPNHVSEKEVKRRDWRWYYKTHPVVAPEPDLEPKLKLRPEDVKSKDFFSSIKSDTEEKLNNGHLQVIVKLANIHLTPDKPSYEGGSWHVEGQVNEHICATALFYYDCENITDSHLDFRTQANGEELDDHEIFSYDQYDWGTIMRIFAINWPGGGSTIQNIGSVLTKEGRALFFPNVYQHHVNSFKLADPKRPGHRKILALFLVDPAIPVISTANVPPQQRSWWLDQVPFSRGRLPPELTDMMLNNVQFPMGEEEAKELREELMQERSVHAWRVADKLKRVEWNFCEH